MTRETTTTTRRPRISLCERLHQEAATATGWWLYNDVSAQIKVLKTLARGTGYRLKVDPTPHPCIEARNRRTGHMITSFRPVDVYWAIFQSHPTL